MGFNKKALSKATANLDARKAQSKPRDIIYDPAGQWKHPGQPTRIPGGDITMRDVPYPVMAYPNVGQPQMMYPEQNYNFPNADYVDEYPQMKKGGLKKYSRDITATNRLFTKNPFLKKKKSKKRKIFDPNSAYYKNGGDFSDDINKRRQVLRDWTYGESIGMLQEQDGGPFKTKLSPEEESGFQKFYQTLPDNLREDDPSYDIRGYWDAEGRPEGFNYDQPKEEDGYYHAYSINPNTGEYLKSPWHETFQHAVDEDRRIGWRPVTNVQGRNIAIENESIASPEAQSFLRNTEGPVNDYIETELTPEEIEVYREGGYVVEEVDKFQKGGTKTHKSKDGTVTNTIQNPDGTQTIQVKTKDGKYFEKTTPVNYEKQLDKLKTEYRDQQDYNKLLNYAGVLAYPASLASSYADTQKGNYGDALLGLVPFVGPRSRLVNNAAKATLEAGTNAGLSYIKALSNANKIKKVVPISTGATQINDVIKQDGGPIDLELTPEEIEWYKSQGYEVEELD